MAWNRSSVDQIAERVEPPKKSVKPSLIKGGVAALVVVLGAAMAWYLLSPTEEERERARRREADMIARADGRQQLVKDARPDITEAAHAAQLAAEAVEESNRVVKAAVKGVCQTTAVHNAESVVILADGTRYVPRKPIFHKPIERMFGKAVQPARAPGSMPGAVIFANRYTDKQLIAMMKEKVVIKPDDTPAMVNAKLDVQELKDKVLKHVAEGGSVRDVFEEIDQQAMDEHRENHFTQVGLREAKKFDDPEVTRAWILKRNERLRELGMPELRVPPAEEPIQVERKLEHDK